MRFGSRSLNEMKGIDERLAIVLGHYMATAEYDLTIIDGYRTAEEQNEHYKNGTSQLDGYKNKSYHQSGLAIDFIPYPFNGWDDTESFEKVAVGLKKSAQHFGFDCEWGGNWVSFKDYPHFQLNER